MLTFPPKLLAISSAPFALIEKLSIFANHFNFELKLLIEPSVFRQKELLSDMISSFFILKEVLVPEKLDAINNGSLNDFSSGIKLFNSQGVTTD